MFHHASHPSPFTHSPFTPPLVVCLPSADVLTIVTTIYGIKNCDTMKKAFAWLDGHGVRYDFHDYKATGIDIGRLQKWAKQTGWEVLLNTRGTTWRKLSPTQQTQLDEAKALKLMSEHPGLIKRPVLESGDNLLVGFTPERYAQTLGKQSGET